MARTEMGRSGSRRSPEPPQPLPAGRARVLLRKLRDLNLTAVQVAVGGGRQVLVDGCLSIDDPVDGALLYRLRPRGSPAQMLHIGWEAGSLRLALSDLQGAVQGRARLIPLLADAEERATAPEIAARVHPENSGGRELEHFMRRLVRAVFRQAPGQRTRLPAS